MDWAIAVVGAVVGVGFAALYLRWVRSRQRAPLPTSPHEFDPDEGVRLLGTARVGRTTAAWPRGELIVDRDALLVRAHVAADPAEVLLERRDVRSVHVVGGRLSRRVTFQISRGPGRDVDPLLFGAAFVDPLPVLRELGWPATGG